MSGIRQNKSLGKLEVFISFVHTHTHTFQSWYKSAASAVAK